MPAYWQLMAWSRTQPFREFERRALPEPTFSQLWEQPADYRGQLFKLRLHIRRVLHYKAPENPLGLLDAYEAWGWTDGSKSFPYVVVFPELPPGLTVGADMQGEVVFAGYFLKLMSYTAFDAKHGAPLFVGRVRSMTSATVPTANSSSTSPSLLVVLCGLVICISLFSWRRLARPKLAVTSALPEQIAFDPDHVLPSAAGWTNAEIQEIPLLADAPAQAAGAPSLVMADPPSLTHSTYESFNQP